MKQNKIKVSEYQDLKPESVSFHTEIYSPALFDYYHTKQEKKTSHAVQVNEGEPRIKK
jgi:hypothetical protein